MDEDEIKMMENKKPKTNLWHRFLGIFGLKNIILAKERKRRLEPKYWPQVKEFMDSINKIIETHTIEDSNVQIINQRILDYIADQINTKGSIENIEERYLALDTLADRILVNNLSKIVGLKKSEGSRPEFSDAVNAFKKHLHERHQQELVDQSQKIKS